MFRMIMTFCGPPTLPTIIKLSWFKLKIMRKSSRPGLEPLRSLEKLTKNNSLKILLRVSTIRYSPIIQPNHCYIIDRFSARHLTIINSNILLHYILICVCCVNWNKFLKYFHDVIFRLLTVTRQPTATSGMLIS